MLGLGLIIFVILLIAVVPSLFVWSLNTLFALGIAYTFKTWLAAFILLACTGCAFQKKK